MGSDGRVRFNKKRDRDNDINIEEEDEVDIKKDNKMKSKKQKQGSVQVGSEFKSKVRKYLKRKFSFLLIVYFNKHSVLEVMFTRKVVNNLTHMFH